MKHGKKQAILDSALSLFVLQGFNATATAKIALHAGVANGSIFHHFHSKQGVIDALYLDLKQQFSSALLEASQVQGESDESFNLWRSALQWFVAHPEKLQFFKLYCDSPDISDKVHEQVIEQLFGFLYEMIEQGKHTNQFKPLDTHYLVQLIQSCLFISAEYALQSGGKLAEPFVKQSYDIIMGILKV